jgi:signal transduction histidine kinase
VKLNSIFSRIVENAKSALSYTRLDPSYKQRVKEFRVRELERTSRIFIYFVVTPVFIEGMNSDFSVLGFRWDILILRTFIIVLTAFVGAMYRLPFFRKNPHLPIFFIYAYVVAYILYIVSLTGYENSPYLIGIFECIFGIILVPLSWSQYLSAFVLTSLALVILTCGHSLEGLRALNTPIFLGFRNCMFLGVFSFFSLNRTRLALYQKDLEKQDDLSARDSVIRAKVNQLLDAEIALELAHIKSEHLQQLNLLASQVSHDIKSPLAALRMATRDLPEMEEDKRILIREAVGRINDIAHMLLEKNNDYRRQSSSADLLGAAQSEKNLVTHIPTLLDSIVSEKRSEYRSRMEIDISWQLADNHINLFAYLNAREFKRVISNLVNNAVESIQIAGKIDLRLIAKDDEITITIQDSGKGMSIDQLSQASKLGYTSGKKSGSGLGLYHAEQIMRSFGGKVAIESKSGVGTILSLYLPRANGPAWFVSEIRLKPKSVIVIIDDDKTIHQVWNEKLNKIRNSLGAVVHLSSPEQLSEFCRNRNIGAHTVFFCVYEFSGSSQNGIDIIMQYEISSQSILVSSHLEDQQVIQKCIQNQIKAVPKVMVGFLTVIGERPDG